MLSFQQCDRMKHKIRKHTKVIITRYGFLSSLWGLVIKDVNFLLKSNNMKKEVCPEQGCKMYPNQLHKSSESHVIQTK